MENKNQLPVQTKVGVSQNVSSKKQQSWKPEEKASLAAALGRMFDLQKTYGKTTSQLENIVAGFLWAMAPYSSEVVINGLLAYMRRNSDMPTPSDIVAIIDPPKPIWKPDWTYYGSLKQLHKDQGPYALTMEEKEYVNACEEYSLGQRRNAQA